MIRHIAAAVAIAIPVGVLSSCSAPSPEADAPTQVTAPETDTSIRAKAVAVVDHLVAGEFAPVIAEFDDTMTAAMPEELLATTMKQLDSQVGAFKERTDIVESEEEGYDVVLVRCVFEKAALNAKVVYDADGKIAGLFFLPAQ